MCRALRRARSYQRTRRCHAGCRHQPGFITIRSAGPTSFATSRPSSDDRFAQPIAVTVAYRNTIARRIATLPVSGQTVAIVQCGQTIRPSRSECERGPASAAIRRPGRGEPQGHTSAKPSLLQIEEKGMKDAEGWMTARAAGHGWPGDGGVMMPEACDHTICHCPLRRS